MVMGRRESKHGWDGVLSLFFAFLFCRSVEKDPRRAAYGYWRYGGKPVENGVKDWIFWLCCND